MSDLDQLQYQKLTCLRRIEGFGVRMCFGKCVTKSQDYEGESEVSEYAFSAKCVTKIREKRNEFKAWECVF